MFPSKKSSSVSRPDNLALSYENVRFNFEVGFNVSSAFNICPVPIVGFSVRYINLPTCPSNLSEISLIGFESRVIIPLLIPFKCLSKNLSSLTQK